MPSSPIPPDRLNVEEFRRLGVRPNELRLGVIRKAATRMARALAEQHLRSPSTQTAVQLSRVATSAYRLLDPRQRTDPHQRAHVGRILPNTLNVAGQTNFSSSPVDVASPIDGLNDAAADQAFVSGDPSLAFDSIDERSPTIGEGPLWSIATDVMQSTVTDLGNVDQPVRPVDVNAWLSTLSDDDLLSASPRERKLRRLRDRILHPWVWFSVFGLVVGSGLGWVTVAPRIQNASFRLVRQDRPVQQADPTSVSSAIAGNIPVEVPKLAVKMPAMESSAVEPERVALSKPESKAVAELDRQRLLPDPWANPNPWANIEADDEQAGTDAAIISADAAMSPVPDSSPLSIPSPAPITVERIAEPAISSPEDAYLARLTDSFAEDDISDATRDQLWLDGLHLCDQLLMDESFEACDRVVAVIGESFGETMTADTADWWATFRGDVAEMKRLRGAIDVSAAKTDGDDGTELRGRYECLMRRRWTPETLAGLGEWSDVRVAAIARMESDTGNDDADLGSLAKRWLAVADRVEGRPSDSIRLHAIDLMHRSAATASALQKLRLQRSIEDVVTLLPDPVRRMKDWAMPPAEQQSDVTPASETEPYPSLTGRLLSGSDDLGVRLIYDLDVSITPNMIAAIELRLNRDLTDVDMVLSGDLMVDKDTTVTISATTDGSASNQAIMVGDTAIDIDPLEGRAAVTLPAGRHTVRWTVKLSAFSSRVSLGIHDAATGRRMPVASTPGPMPASFDVVMPRVK